MLTRLVSREGIDAELALDTRDLTLSLSEAVIFMSVEISSSRTEPSVSQSIGVEDDELPETVLAMESFFLWFMIGVILLRNLDSLLLFALTLA